MFPFKHYGVNWNKYKDDYISLIDRLNAKKKDKIKMFCILYNCMVSVFGIGDNNYGALDKYIRDYDTTKNDDNMHLNSFCQWYILVAMVKSGIFGTDKNLTSP